MALAPARAHTAPGPGGAAGPGGPAPRGGDTGAARAVRGARAALGAPAAASTRVGAARAAGAAGAGARAPGLAASAVGVGAALCRAAGPARGPRRRAVARARQAAQGSTVERQRDLTACDGSDLFTAKLAKDTRRATGAQLEKQLVQVAAWKDRLFRGMRQEHEFGKELLRQRWSASSLEQLVRQGLVLADMTAFERGLNFGDPSYRFSCPAGAALPKRHDFSVGSMIIVSLGSPMSTDATEAMVIRLEADAVICSIKRSLVNKPGSLWRLIALNNHSRYSLKEPVLRFADAAFQAREVQLIVAGSGDVSRLNSLPPRLHWRLAERFAPLQVNASQSEAIGSVERQRVSLVKGPPGCGKTRFACALLEAAAKDWKVKKPLLAVAQSHVAVDTLLSGLMALGVKAVRMGYAARVTERQVRCRSLQALFEEHPYFEQFQKSTEGWERRRLRANISEDILDNCDVICGTLSSCVQLQQLVPRFGLILIDEASQASEIEVMPALTCLEPNGRVVLIGDEHQLPPVVNSDGARREGFDVSLFEGLLGRGISPTLLNVQYRMHPMIARWPSETFYGGQIEDGVSAADRPLLPGFPWPAAGGVAFIPADGPEQQRGSSVANEGECLMVQRVLHYFLKAGVSLRDIGIISHYSAQVRLLERVLPDQVQVRSVDGFQGREKDAIIISCVRSNARGAVGFLTDERRINVSLTRAKRGLIVIGNPETLRNCPRWSRWLEFVDRHGLTVELPPLPARRSPQRTRGPG